MAIAFFLASPLAAADSLSWGSPSQSKPASNSLVFNRPQLDAEQRSGNSFPDDQVAPAAWEDDAEELSLGSPAPEHDPFEEEDHSVVVRRSELPRQDEYDPFEEETDDQLGQPRVAQLPDDPFEEPEEELMPEPEDDLGEVEEAIEQEIERRRAAEDLRDDDAADRLRDERDPFAEPEQLRDEQDEPADEDDDQPEIDTDLDIDIDDDQFGTPYEGLQDLIERGMEEHRMQLEEERRQIAENCEEERNSLREDRITQIDLNIELEGTPGEDFPLECTLGSDTLEPRSWPQITYTWKASGLCHKPLYFEQVQLERYGHSWGPYVQPIMSGVHFFGTLPILPYKMGLKTPNECVYTLGYYRPGNCAPYMIEALPFTWRAAAFEAGAATGISFIIP